MAQPIFPKWLNSARLVILAVLAGGPVYAVVLLGYGASPKTLNVGYQPDQPVPFSHKLHAGDLGLDCRYCHNTVEKAYHAAVPPTATCLNCHTNIHPSSVRLAEVRKSGETGEPIPWVRVHKLPDYVYFNHAAHIQGGVSCVSCHGRVDTMEKVHQVEPLSMGWCLECHRAPENHLRPADKVFELAWKADSEEAQIALGLELKDKHNINPSTDCSTCHR
ncbi:MAG: cytochrome c3 family protein [Planctomycetota bacterium]